MNFKKKLKASTTTVLRTPQVIDQEYSNEAAQIGHKIRIIDELESQIVKHKENLVLLNKEAVVSQRSYEKANQKQEKSEEPVEPDVPMNRSPLANEQAQAPQETL